MARQCWDIAGCGRGPGGAKVGALGPCPAAKAQAADGVNGGRNAGRACWAAVGTFGGGKVCEPYRDHKSCLSCPVLKQVRAEEGDGFRLLPPGQRYVAPPRTGTG